MIIKELGEKKLSLTNKGELSLFFVGIGSAFARKHYQTNLLIIKGKDHLLIDCGTRCSQALLDIGLKTIDIDNFLITHSHADHIGGLEEVSMVNRYFAKKKANMIITETYQNILWDMSLKGGSAFSEEKDGAALSLADFWNIKRPRWLLNYPRETFEADAGNINIKMFRTKHVPENSESWDTSLWSCGIIIDDRVMFTSDTRFDADLIESYDKIFHFENIFHDCQFFTGGVHASLEELKELPAEIKSRIYLTHYGDNWEDFKEKIAEYGFAGLANQWVFYIYNKRAA